MEKPALKPENPCFSSGPCAKHPGYSLEALRDTPLGRSHRSALGRSRLFESIRKTKELLGIPEEYLVGIVPASDTGAIEMAIWNLLGERAVDVIYFEAFGKEWAHDILNELKLEEVRVFSAGYGFLPDLSRVDFEHDLVFTWNGTTSGVKVPNGDFIPSQRQGLTICDATSAVFAMEIPWEKLDAATFSWQKVLGGEAAHGMLVLSPRAVERIESYRPPWPIPKIFRLKKNGKLIRGIFEGSTINTPSLLCNEDYLAALHWAESIGGLPALIRRSENNLKVIENFVSEHDWIHFLAADPAIRSNTSVCLTVDLPPERLQQLIKLLEDEGAAYDIASYREAPPGLRFWCGATVEQSDLELALQWLEWAYNSIAYRKHSGERE
ncbi:MAG TPA: phosphoserine transaminase [Bacillota bacterium]|jgi:phosphoserine aminotransferase|nr:phosphoserine transaminase [Bacillota bacterium]HOA36015.1 phosphoserine transaminase [Bacillota bacterium]HPZ12116.1 phosphoserine transaminase [Bacillota bacterium]HQE10385.1 phosphoserine transaminase [Bacillota bacterium]